LTVFQFLITDDPGRNGKEEKEEDGDKRVQ